MSNKSIYRGVSWDKKSNKWRSVLNYQKRSYSIGRYESELDAALAYNEKALKIIGKNASLNVMGEGYVASSGGNGIVDWTEKDLELLKILHSTNMSAIEMGEVLNRTEGSVKVMASKLGLVNNDMHSMSHTRPYRIWRAMRGRVNNVNNDRYERYGGRGIKISKDWETFSGFWKDMSKGYDDSLSIGRVNNDLGYNKENCRWETREQQDNNTSRTVWIEYNGERKSLTQWAKDCGINPKTLEGRMKSGWSIEDSIETPIRKY